MAVSKERDTTEEELAKFENNMKYMPTDMRDFSQAMRALYAEEAIGGESRVSKKFRKLRDDTRNDAVVYLKGVLPLTTKFVLTLSEYFEVYTTLSYDDWCEMLPDIHQDATGYKQLAETLVEIHRDMLTMLKKREDDAKVIVKEFKELKLKFDKQRQELQKTAETKRHVALKVSVVPIVGTLLYASADIDQASAAAAREEKEIHNTAAFTVSNTLIPALKNFIGGLHAAAGFFSVMEFEMGKFEGNAERGVREKKQLHFKMMAGEAKKMDELCKNFFAVLPAVRTDFEAIPSEGSDKSYVDKWLAKQKQVIINRILQPKLFDNIMQAITGN